MIYFFSEDFDLWFSSFSDSFHVWIRRPIFHIIKFSQTCYQYFVLIYIQYVIELKSIFFILVIVAISISMQDILYCLFLAGFPIFYCIGYFKETQEFSFLKLRMFLLNDRLHKRCTSSNLGSILSNLTWLHFSDCSIPFEKK